MRKMNVTEDTIGRKSKRDSGENLSGREMIGGISKIQRHRGEVEQRKWQRGRDKSNISGGQKVKGAEKAR